MGSDSTWAPPLNVPSPTHGSAAPSKPASMTSFGIQFLQQSAMPIQLRRRQQSHRHMEEIDLGHRNQGFRMPSYCPWGCQKWIHSGRRSDIAGCCRWFKGSKKYGGIMPTISLTTVIQLRVMFKFVTLELSIPLSFNLLVYEYLHFSCFFTRVNGVLAWLYVICRSCILNVLRFN